MRLIFWWLLFFFKGCLLAAFLAFVFVFAIVLSSLGATQNNAAETSGLFVCFLDWKDDFSFWTAVSSPWTANSSYLMLNWKIFQFWWFFKFNWCWFKYKCVVESSNSIIHSPYGLNALVFFVTLFGRTDRFRCTHTRTNTRSIMGWIYGADAHLAW